MALFPTYDAFQSSVQRRLGRSVIGRFDEWVRITETWLENGLSMMGRPVTPPLRIDELEEFLSYAEIPAEGVEYPDDYLSPITITANTRDGNIDVPLLYRTPGQFDETSRSRIEAAYTVRQRHLVFSTEVLGNLRILYRKQIPTLTADNLATHPVWNSDAQVYLFGVLAAAHKEFRNQNEEELCFRQYASAVHGLNQRSARAMEGSAPMRAVIVGGIP